MQQLLDRDEKRDAIASARRNIIYLSAFIRRDVNDYKLGFKHEILTTDNGDSLTLLFNSEKKSIFISEAEFGYRKMQGKRSGSKLANLQIEYAMNKYLAREHVWEAFAISPAEALGLAMRRTTTVNPEDLSLYLANHTLMYEENSAKADAMLKLISLMSLYDAFGQRNWKRFTEAGLRLLRVANTNWLSFTENNDELKQIGFEEEVRRASREWEKSHSFSEYTLRFLDKIHNRTNDTASQAELLSDVFASVFLREYPKRDRLEGLMFNFFDEQYAKQKIVERMVPRKKPKNMRVAVESASDEFFRRIKQAAKRSATPPRTATDLAKEWSEN
jgi:hypothetical protein